MWIFFLWFLTTHFVNFFTTLIMWVWLLYVYSHKKWKNAMQSMHSNTLQFNYLGMQVRSPPFDNILACFLVFLWTWIMVYCQ